MSMINVANLTFAYDGNYDNVFENVSFKLDTDWKLGFTGRNGRGKTTFLKLLMGKYDYSGAISHDVEFDYFPFEVSDKSQFSIDIIKEKSRIEDYEYWKIQKEISLLDVDEDILYRPFETLSGGEQVKVLLVGLFLKENCFLLIDEPTNHLDANTREVVSNYLKEKKDSYSFRMTANFLTTALTTFCQSTKQILKFKKATFLLGMKINKIKITLKLLKMKNLKKILIG